MVRGDAVVSCRLVTVVIQGAVCFGPPFSAFWIEVIGDGFSMKLKYSLSGFEYSRCKTCMVCPGRASFSSSNSQRPIAMRACRWRVSLARMISKQNPPEMTH